MDDADFNGTLVLEGMAASGKLDEFAEAVDADDVDEVTRLLLHRRVKLPSAVAALHTAQSVHIGSILVSGYWPCRLVAARVFATTTNTVLTLATPFFIPDRAPR